MLKPMDIPGVDVAALLRAPEILDCKRALCIQPHPDDNEIGMGGVIAVLAKRGCELHYLTVTKGEQGNRDLRASPEETAAIRRREAVAAGQCLGVRDFHFLEHGDGALSDITGLSREIALLIRRIRPEAVFCPDPWLFYEGHYDHVVTGRAAANAFHMSVRTRLEDAGGTEPWEARAIGFYFTANPNTIIDISGVFEQKFAAIALHDSQADAQTLALYRTYFQMKGAELAQGRGFDLGEGLKVLGRLHTHCFVDAVRL
jgi:LmbE family N-acetylglucosaminyl deacetylase